MQHDKHTLRKALWLEGLFIIYALYNAISWGEKRRAPEPPPSPHFEKLPTNTEQFSITACKLAHVVIWSFADLGRKLKADHLGKLGRGEDSIRGSSSALTRARES